MSLYANAGWKVSEDFGLRVFVTHVDNDQELAGALTSAQFNDDPSQAHPSAITGNFQLNVRTSRLAAKGTWNIDTGSRAHRGRRLWDSGPSSDRPARGEGDEGKPPQYVDPRGSDDAAR